MDRETNEKQKLLEKTKRNVAKLESLIEGWKSGILFLLGISVSLWTNVFTSILVGSWQHLLDTNSSVHSVISTIVFVCFAVTVLLGYLFVRSQWTKPIKKIHKEIQEALIILKK